MGSCLRCGGGLGIADRAKGRHICGRCREEVAHDSAVAEAKYPAALEAVVCGTEPATALVSLERAMSAGGRDPAVAKAAYLSRRIQDALVDEVLTQPEETALMRVAQLVYSDPQAISAAFAPFWSQIIVARVNDGRLPVVEDATLVLKKGEQVHLEEPAELLKEVIHREFQGGSRGVSFRVAKGVTYRVGAVRGRMVEVGRSLETADTGDLHVTSQRVVYSGVRKSIEIPYAKLLDMSVFTDGIQLDATNRQNPPMFRVESGPVVAAVINAAMQRVA